MHATAPARVPVSLDDIEADVFRTVSDRVQLRLRWLGDDVLLEFLYVPGAYRGQGLADAALERVCELVDLAGWAMRLQPSDGFGSDLGRLCRWYYRHGFVPVGDPRFVSEIQWMERPTRGGTSPTR